VIDAQVARHPCGRADGVLGIAVVVEEGGAVVQRELGSQAWAMVE
jgi:hypothetical protein